MAVFNRNLLIEENSNMKKCKFYLSIYVIDARKAHGKGEHYLSPDFEIGLTKLSLHLIIEKKIVNFIFHKWRKIFKH